MRMISLSDYSTYFIDNYKQDIGEKVYTNAHKDMYFWKKCFPESFKGATLDKHFFEDILTLTIQESCQKYDSVKNYYDFAFFSALSIDRVHAKERSTKIRISNRQRYIDNYVNVNMHAKQILNRLLPSENPISNDNNFKELQRRMKKILFRLNKRIENSINYTDLIKIRHRAAIIDDLEIRVCPYCNRQYITNLDIDGSEKPLGDIDHFFSQNYFALFGVSLYNFVPSCKVCNSIFKSDVNADIQYPYRMDDACNITFEIADSKGILSPASLFGWNDDISVKLVSDERGCCDKGKAEREIDFFQLNAQYGIHKDYVRDFLYKKNVVNGLVIKQLKEYFSTKGSILTEEDIKEVIYGFDVDNIDLLEKPLAKLTKDLYEKY